MRTLNLNNLNNINDLSKDEFLKLVNKLRLENKNKWLAIIATVESKSVLLKFFNTSIQRYDINGLDYGGSYDENVRDFKKSIIKPFLGKEND